MKDSSSRIPPSATTGSQSELREIKRWRPVFYKLVWLGFSYPDARLLDRFDTEDFLEGMIETSRAYDLGVEGEILKRNKELAAGQRKSILEEMETEYVRLFIAEVGGALIQPYGSIYLDGEVRGRSTKQVVEAYSHAGFEKSEEYSDLPDHFSTEVEFMYKLSQKDDPKSLTRFRDFYDEYFAPWYGEFVEDVWQKTEYWFYGLLARWANKGFKADRKAVKEILSNTERE
ncbi:molecular chaperone TorD family protein [Candidatus Bipolaricaulota bacterium]|nr:molecular chaperone TorD family protein [Candidatus Bipolaricaulota bacterium]